MNLSSKKYLIFDAETHNGGREWSMPAEEFVRVMQYAWGDGPVQFCYDVHEMREIIRSADYLVGHNIISADLGWIFGQDSTEPYYLARDRKVLDTYVLASLVKPAPYMYTNAKGQKIFDAAKPERAMKYLSLDNMCHIFDIPGKFGSLQELAKKYNPPKTLVRNLAYSLIPLDDEEFVGYMIQDVVSARELFGKLQEEIKEQDYDRECIWFELEVASIMAQMSRNGILVDQEWGHRRVAEQAEKKKEVLDWLVAEYNFPTEGKSPWATTEGKEIIFKVLEDFGVTEKSHPDWERTATGNLSLGGDAIKELCEGISPEAEEFAEQLAILKGQRTLAQLTLDETKEDGRVHPRISALQRSSRWSFTNPGITIFGSNGGRDIDKEIFIATEGNELAGFDYSNADARAMAGASGDHEYGKRFTDLDENGEELHDGHNLTGVSLFGEDVYYGGETPGKKARPPLRAPAKVAGHALNYNIGAKKLHASLNKQIKKDNLPLEDFTLNQVYRMVDAFNESYPFLKYFKDEVVKFAQTNGYVELANGRRLIVDPERAWTQAPGLAGQGVTRMIMAQSLVRIARLGDYWLRCLRAVIHDELLTELNSDRIEEEMAVIKEQMEVEFDPKNRVGYKILFPVGSGHGRSWRDANH